MGLASLAVASPPIATTVGEAQLVAQQLLVSNLQEYPDLKWTILQLVGCTPEQHHQRLLLPICLRPTAPGCLSRRLLADECDAYGIIDLVLQEY